MRSKRDKIRWEKALVCLLRPCLAALGDVAARRQPKAAPGRHTNAYAQRAMSACATLSASG